MNEYVYYSRGVPLKDCFGDISLPREEIVRCLDCRFKAKDGDFRYRCRLHEFAIETTGFCKWGKRKETK